MFLPGSNMEFFTLERYREELGKDYKRITLFLCTLTDFRMSEGGVPVDGKQPEDKLWDEAIDLPDTVYQVQDDDNHPSDNTHGNKADVNITACLCHDSTVGHHSEESQINDDFQIAQALQASLDSVLVPPEEETLDKSVSHSDHPSVIQALEKRVVTTEQFFLVVRRGIPFE